VTRTLIRASGGKLHVFLGAKVAQGFRKASPFEEGAYLSSWDKDQYWLRFSYVRGAIALCGSEIGIGDGRGRSQFVQEGEEYTIKTRNRTYKYQVTCISCRHASEAE